MVITLIQASSLTWIIQKPLLHKGAGVTPLTCTSNDISPLLKMSIPLSTKAKVFTLTHKALPDLASCSLFDLLSPTLPCSHHTNHPDFLAILQTCQDDSCPRAFTSLPSWTRNCSLRELQDLPPYFHHFLILMSPNHWEPPWLSCIKKHPSFQQVFAKSTLSCFISLTGCDHFQGSSPQLLYFSPWMWSLPGQLPSISRIVLSTHFDIRYRHMTCLCPWNVAHVSS